MGLQSPPRRIARQAEANRRGEIAPPQHQQRGKCLLQAGGTERHMPGGAGDRATNRAGLLDSNPAASPLGRRDGQQPQCPGKRQHAEDKAHGEQVQGRLQGELPLRRRQ
jgi:hypothetical protein